MKKLVFYKCNTCGNVVIKLVDKKVPLFCCGKMMEELVPFATDGVVEKHKPVVTQEGATVLVKVGQTPHPMTEEHYISHIIILTNFGYYVRELHPQDKPETIYTLAEGEKVEKVYSLCNLHGLWANE